MIPRYSRAPMREIWSSRNKFQIWLDIEIYACEAMEQYGTVPKGTSKKIKSKAKINEKRIDAIEREVKHDVIAFLTSISEYVGTPARFLHQGLTSSDIILFGRESAGVPDNVHQIVDHRLTIPMKEGVRSINLSSYVALVVGESIRQINII